jgi:hypothetical protein
MDHVFLDNDDTTDFLPQSPYHVAGPGRLPPRVCPPGRGGLFILFHAFSLLSFYFEMPMTVKYSFTD